MPKRNLWARLLLMQPALGWRWDSFAPPIPAGVTGFPLQLWCHKTQACTVLCPMHPLSSSVSALPPRVPVKFP